MNIEEGHELAPYVHVALDRTVGWVARELAGRAIAATARSHIWLTSRKATHVYDGVGGHAEQAVDLHERAVRVWRGYQETGDGAALTAHLRGIVSALEALAPSEE